MNNTEYPPLNAGIIFALIMHAKNNFSTGASLYKQSTVYKKLVELIAPDFYKHNQPAQQTFKALALHLKGCEKYSGKSNIFDERNQTAVDEFDARIKDERLKLTILKACKEFIDAALPSKKAKVWFTIALLEIIRCDDTIAPTDKFYSAEDSCLLTNKSELLAEDLHEICLPSFFLGVLHFAVMNRKPYVADNIMDKLFPRNTSNERILSIDLTKDFSREITVTMDSEGTSERFFPEYKSVDIDSLEYTTDEVGNIATYLNNLLKRHNRIKTILYSNREQPFYKYFVCNQVTRREKYIGRKKNQSSKHNDNSQRLMELVDNEGLIKVNKAKYITGKYIIVGNGGEGKSIMLNHILLKAVQHFYVEKEIPIFVNLRDYNFADSIQKFLFKKYSALGGPLTLKEFQDDLKESKYLILLDGLDEINGDLITKFENSLNDFTSEHSMNRIILTSRPVNNFMHLHSYEVFTIEPFSKDQALELIEKIDYSTKKSITKSLFYEEVDNNLYCNIFYKDFVSNPLLLTLMFIVFDEHTSLPKEKYKFFELAYNEITYEHDSDKGYDRKLALNVSVNQFTEYFMEFCFRTYFLDKFNFTRQQLLDIFSRLKSVNQNGQNNRGDDFIKDVTANMSLIYKDGTNYSFIHRTFQDYQTAVRISKKVNDSDLLGFAKMLAERYKSNRKDYVFEMLYELIPDKIEEFVFKPYLDEIFSQCKGSNAYLQFLNHAYSYLYFNDGETDVISGNEINDYLLAFIQHHYLDSANQYIEITDAISSYNDDFIVETYYEVELFDPEINAYYSEIVSENDARFKNSHDVDASECGHIAYISPYYLLKDAENNPDIENCKHKDCLNIINDKFYRLRLVYEEFKQYYENLCNKTFNNTYLSLLDKY